MNTNRRNAKNGRYAHIKAGHAYDLSDGVYYKSGWERDFSRFLFFLLGNGFIEGYEYEPQRFNFLGHYSSNPLFYVPDFVLRTTAFSPSNGVAKMLRDNVMEDFNPSSTLYVEVKGQETGKDRNKWRRFRKVTEHTLNVVKQPEMRWIQENIAPKMGIWESNVR